MRSFRIQRGIVIVLVALCVAVLAGRINRFRLPVLEPQSIPQAIRDRIPHFRTDIVWRAFVTCDQYTFLAYTFRLEAEGRWHYMYEVEVYRRDGSSVGGGTGDPTLPFAWHARSGIGYDYEQGTIIRYLGAHGTAFDSAVVKVVGTTSAGTQVEGAVHGGFWAMGFASAQQGEQWETLTAVRADGSVRHRYRVDRWR